ncbi:uncharacterized protein UV8b_03072 [Ustilaginoidea virens]|uniref:Uncharacterized protein n=1 Tax=Ustilaginoidea virens TaxID=1159556 RepID=A0A8E5MGQ3_USTVR|nr:uncharacterized protein UV8b_03072 [Ustilaginoidea virens]QUC18831.1 hypothetical protein UV8b_03072 [Ustilaginoidea virens]
MRVPSVDGNWTDHSPDAAWLGDGEERLPRFGSPSSLHLSVPASCCVAMSATSQDHPMTATGG